MSTIPQINIDIEFDFLNYFPVSIKEFKEDDGRFYFPNVDKQDNYGKDKPSAYQGYRNIVLEFLMYFYDTAKRDDVKVHVHALWSFMRLYTSAVFKNLLLISV